MTVSHDILTRHHPTVHVTTLQCLKVLHFFTRSCCLCYPEDSFVSFSFASDACWPCWILRPDKCEPSSTGRLLMSRSSEFWIKVYLCVIEISGNVLPSLTVVKYIICCGGLGRRFTCGGSFLPCWADVKYLLWQFWEKVYLWWKFLAFVSQSPRLSRCEIFAMEFPEEGLPMMEFSDHVLLGCRHVKYLLWSFPEKAYHDGNFWPCSSGVRTGEVVFAGEIFGEGLPMMEISDLALFSSPRLSRCDACAVEFSGEGLCFRMLDFAFKAVQFI